MCSQPADGGTPLYGLYRPQTKKGMVFIPFGINRVWFLYSSLEGVSNFWSGHK